MIRTLLIANRGEIAIRIARTARSMGIRSIGVFSDIDRDALHVRAMDEAHGIGPADPSQSYLNADRILRVAHDTRSDGIHPGYGFLAENAGFAARCVEEGISFVGPTAHAIALTGDKIAARQAMARAGIPVTRGADRVVRSVREAREVAKDLGFPVLFKATGGGGGIGMSRVDGTDRLASAFESARSVARTNFGNPDLFLESYLEGARHIEVQVVLGPRGSGVVLGERECSVQRRHQKLVEETPSPALSPGHRKQIGAAALRGLRALGYTNAGTVEFLFHEGRFTFNEVNARLQVEHPVTELVAGVDLVRQQLLVASGEDLEVSPSKVRLRGHALECRINAEDPIHGFLPSPGRVLAYSEPEGPGIRVDSGIERGSEVPPMYDPLVAKVIVHGRTRADSIRRMREALASFDIRGIRTTIPFHQALLRHSEFRRGHLWTTMVADLRIADRLQGRGPAEARVAAIAAALASTPGLFALAARERFLPPRGSAWAIAGSRERLGGSDALRSRRRW